MQITSANALLAATVFASLADERYTMRTVTAIRKGTEFTEEQVNEFVAATHLQILRRVADNAPLVVRPLDRAKMIELSEKAMALTTDAGGETFDVDFEPEIEPLPEHDVMADVEAGLGRPAAAVADDDEDAQFN